MSRRSPSRLLLLAIVLAALPRGASAEVRLTVGGTLQESPEALDISLVLTNAGDDNASAVNVTADFKGRRAAGRPEAGIAPGAAVTVPLHFPGVALSPGLHAVDLLLNYVRLIPGGTAAVSQRAYMLVGTAQPERVAVRPAELSLDTVGHLKVELASSDGRARKARLRVTVPNTLQAPDPPPEVLVPATGSVTAEVRILRSSAARPSREGVLVLAETEEDGVAGVSVTPAVVAVERDPALLPRIRRPMIVVAGVLVALAGVLEVLRQRRDRRPPDVPLSATEAPGS